MGLNYFYLFYTNIIFNKTCSQKTIHFLKSCFFPSLLVKSALWGELCS